MSGSGRDTLPDVPVGWEALPDVRQLSGGPPGYAGVVRRPSQKFGRPSWKFGRLNWRSGIGRDTLPDDPEGWEALPDVWE